MPPAREIPAYESSITFLNLAFQAATAAPPGKWDVAHWEPAAALVSRLAVRQGSWEKHPERWEGEVRAV